MKDSVNIALSDAAARDWEQKRAAIKRDGSLSAKERTRKIEALGILNKKVARRGTSFWGFDGVRVVDVSILEEADLAVARLDGFNKASVSE
jgi:hypothetical protein